MRRSGASGRKGNEFFSLKNSFLPVELHLIIRHGGQTNMDLAWDKPWSSSTWKRNGKQRQQKQQPRQTACQHSASTPYRFACYYCRCHCCCAAAAVVRWSIVQEERESNSVTCRYHFSGTEKKCRHVMSACFCCFFLCIPTGDRPKNKTHQLLAFTSLLMLVL